jgi:transposase-like protein
MRDTTRTRPDGLKLARRWFTLDFKIMVVRHKKANGLSCAAVGRKYSVMPKLIRAWEELYDAGKLTVDAGRRPVTQHQAEISKLRAELSRVKVEVASLKGRTRESGAALMTAHIFRDAPPQKHP